MTRDPSEVRAMLVLAMVLTWAVSNLLWLVWTHAECAVVCRPYAVEKAIPCECDR